MEAHVIPLHQVVRLEGDRIVIERLSLSDPTLAAFLGERPAGDRGPLVERALRIGLLALQDTGVTSTDYRYIGVKGANFLSTIQTPSPVGLTAAQANAAGLTTANGIHGIAGGRRGALAVGGVEAQRSAAAPRRRRPPSSPQGKAYSESMTVPRQ